MTDNKLTDTELDVLFNAARQSPAAAPDDWLARVAIDAEQAQTAAPDPAPRPGLWAQITNAIGGWQGLGGMVVASATGLWIGVAPPAVLGDPVSLAFGGDSTLAALTGPSFEFASLLDEE